METLEQINDRFLKIATEVNEYIKYAEQQEKCLKQPLNSVDLKALTESKIYLDEHKFLMEEKMEQSTKEWKKICNCRTFDYEVFGKILAILLTKTEGVPYFYATRLVKHPFQVDEINRPFYRIVSFVTKNPKDLEVFLLEKISATMYPYYMNNSPVIKPLARELEERTIFEKMIKKELEVREVTNAYVVTKHDISISGSFKKPENQILLPTFLHGSIDVIIEKMIEKRYQKNGKQLTALEIEEIIAEFITTQKQTTGILI